MPWREELARVEPTAVEDAAIANFDTEGQHTRVAVDLVIEVGSYVCVAANIFRTPDLSWNRNEAILGGQLVRTFKLLDALLDQTCSGRRETSMLIARTVFECVVNLRYMIANASDELFRSYMAYSLQHELKLLEKIERNVAGRDSGALPIEDRMVQSILASFHASGLTRVDVAAQRQRNWSGHNLFERAERLGLDEAYLAAFGGGSHSVHGNWQDLLEYHLEKVDDTQYRPNLNWHAPRPQILQALALLVADAVWDYVEAFTEGGADDFISRIVDLKERVGRASTLHEEFLVRIHAGRE
jgi:hypothetical protein